MDRRTFELLARYNRWANERLYEAAASLSDEERTADRGLFFRSIHATLNHILVADRIWMKRFTGTGAAPDRLDAILFEAFEDLRAARKADDERISGWIASLDDQALESDFAHPQGPRAEVRAEPLAPVVLHLFNHQTHHRGQCHAGLTGLERDAPSLDMVAFLRERRS